MKRLVILLLILSLVLVNSIFVYADSETSGSDPVVSEFEVVVTEEDLRQIDSEIYSTAENLKAVLNASNSDVTYTTDDIYNLLKFYFDWDFWNHGSGTGQTWTNVTWQALSTCRDRLTTINTSCNAIVTKITEIAGYDQTIASALGTDWSVSLRQAIDDIYQTLKISVTDQQGNIVNYSAAQLLLLIEDRVTNIENYCTSIESMLATLNNTSQGILSVCNTISNTAVQIATNTANTVTAVNNNTNAINNLRDDYNNITWLTLSDMYLGFKHNYNDPDYTSGSFNYVNYPVGYFFFNNPNLSSGRLYNFALPVRVNSILTDFIENIEIVYQSSTTEYTYVPVYYYEYDITKNFVKVYCLNSYFQFSSARPVVFKVTFKRQYIVNSTAYDLSYLNSSSKDYYDVYQYITNLKQNKTLSKFEMLYASDDLIKAKENQQTYEDQAIQDFTGSGSAAAGVSDIGNLKDLSGSLKSGISSGGSVSNALGVFNTSSSFWGWFSQDNYNDINTVHSSSSGNRLLKSGSGDPEPEVIDFYSQNWNDIQNSLGGD